MNFNKIILAFFFTTLIFSAYAQQRDWTADEIEYYKKTKELCNFLKQNKYDSSKRDFVFSNYILYTNPKNDTSQNRLNYFDMLFYHFYHFIDSVGLQNLDAKPVRFFKSDKMFYKPFKVDLKWADSMTLAYFDKRRPDKPLGSLLYDQKSHRLVSWIILNMEGYIFITSNLY